MLVFCDVAHRDGTPHASMGAAGVPQGTTLRGSEERTGNAVAARRARKARDQPHAIMERGLGFGKA
jgi:hypothetical protein